jgi:pyruvate formate lyase activating enzyme
MFKSKQAENHLANYWHALNEETIQCDLCPRVCKLKEGQRGFCFVRQNMDQKLILTTYGRSSGFCIDPIEKKPLNHFYPGTSVLSFGTAGCNMGCIFCQNWDISKSREMDKLQTIASPKQIATKAKSLNCASVAYTYNDPVIFAEYAIDTAKECHKLGIKNVAVTAGYINEKPRAAFFEFMDATNVDLKGFNEAFYEKYCMAKLQPVLDTLIYLKNETKVWLEITNLVIPGVNDNETELKKMCDWIFKNLGPNVPLHFTAFHPAYKLNDLVTTPENILRKARHLALDAGLNYVYTGNIVDPEGATTYCPNCNDPLIERHYYEIRKYNLQDHKCANCGYGIPGCFGLHQGDWGNQRLPISI